MRLGVQKLGGKSLDLDRDIHARRQVQFLQLIDRFRGRLDDVEQAFVGANLKLIHRLFVDVIGRSKGKGFQGVMKKHNFDGQGAAHGSKTHRRNGAVGNRSTPGRIWKNMGMPGHLGDERVTVQNLQVMQVREAEKVILISGAVPGCNGSYVVVRPAIKNPAAQIRLHQQHAKQDKAVAKKHEAEKKAEEKKPEAAKKPEADKKPEAAEKK